MNGSSPKTISIFGSTGSVGLSSVDVILQYPEKFIVDTIVAKSNIKKLAEVAKLLKPKLVIVCDGSKVKKLRILLSKEKCEIQSGEIAVIKASARKVDIFIAAITGIAGLRSTINCIKHVKLIALANKESLVCFGENIMKSAKSNNCKIIPLDSEHNALYQIINSKEKKFIKRLIITCSGGPFLGYKRKDLYNVTPGQALKHPIWNMGNKISIDSATLMNKGLELIEAVYLFGIKESQIDVLIHPQSIIHGLVEYIDGSTKANMGTPDMRTPISFALNWPNREITKAKYLELSKIKSLTFDNLDEDVFPAIKLCREVVRQGGTAPAILNAANEIVVNSFLKKRIKFFNIIEIIEEVLSTLDITQNINLDSIIIADRNARKLTKNIIKDLSL
ncbi:MAG: 1-deoxy-D-xylulose-5-phosphate reductoisomerase [Pelagibacterales bacterium]|nr:1-deoxy-D-xylulose-5-phosphate reductoisomerase [Pelagibacterales bacterium]